MAYEIAVKPGARKDMAESYFWYEDQKAGLGEEFLEEIRLKLKSLEINPLVFQIVKNPFRQAPLKRFPFVIVYEILQREVIIYAVFHTNRSPKKKWRR